MRRSAVKHAGAFSVPWLVTILLALSVIWGSQYLVIRVATQTLPVLAALALRFAVVWACAQVWLWRAPAPVPSGHRAGRLLYGLTHLSSMALLYWGQQHVPVAITGMLLALGPLFVTMLAHGLVPGERLRRADVLPLLVATAGTVAMIHGASANAPGTAPGSWVALGCLGVMGAALSGAALRVTAKRLVEVIPVPVMLRDMGAVVAVGATTMSVLLEHPLDWSPSAVSLGAAVYLGAVASVFATGLYLRVLRDVAVGLLAYQQFLTALVSVVLGVTLGEDRLSGTSVAGGAAVLAALALRLHRPVGVDNSSAALKTIVHSGAQETRPSWPR